MTVRINKPALNLREELTKAQGVVRYEQRQFWMDGLVENGTFDTDTSGWVAENSATIAQVSGELEVTYGSLFSRAKQDVSPKAGNYFVTVDAYKGTATSFDIRLGSHVGTTVYGSALGQTNTTKQTFTFNVTVPSNTPFYIFLNVNGSSGQTAYFDNVQVFEVDENDNVIHSLPLGFKPVHVYEDGLLQREGENHDYTVVNTGFGYQVKPTVAPSATTETCIIAEREL